MQHFANTDGLKTFRRARKIGKIRAEVQKNNPKLSKKQAQQIAEKNYRLQNHR